MYQNIQAIFDNFDAELTIIAKTIEGSSRMSQINFLEECYSPVAAWLRLLMDWNDQVENGGHMQYVGNNLHSFADGAGYHYRTSQDLHDKLIYLTLQVKETVSFPEYDELLSILKAFKVELGDHNTDVACSCCCGAGTQEVCVDEDEDLYEDQECDNCDGTGVETEDRSSEIHEDCVELFEKLDDRWYAIADSALKNIDAALAK